MDGTLRLTRRARLFDEIRIERCRRLPELGPRVLFFSGGTALRPLSRRLKLYTTNSIHLVTPFDSGGSSALLREAFRMPAVGDLRNRLMALADETERGNPEVYRLFSHRFGADEDPRELGDQLALMVCGDHPLVSSVPAPLRRIIRTHLRLFVERMPPGFDLRRASIGNLILAGGYLNNERDLESVLFLFSRLVQARGTVALTAEVDRHLAADLADGSRVVGQHRITAHGREAGGAPIVGLTVVDSLAEARAIETTVDERTVALISSTDLVVYPMGSFYTSVVANLLPRGVGRAVANAECPKIFVPSTGVDPEQAGSTLLSSVERLIRCVREDAGASVPIRAALDAVILDANDASYATELDGAAIERLGIDVVRTPLVLPGSGGTIDPEILARLLVSIS